MANTVPYTSLPGVIVDPQEGGLVPPVPITGPVTLVLGTAAQGDATKPFRVITSALAASQYGSSGTLTRGMYEVARGGAENILLFRIGATPAKLQHVGDSTGAAGYTVTTYRRDDDAGEVYTIYYDDSEDHLIIWNSLTGVIVYDSEDGIDLGEVIVSGKRASGGGPDLGGPSAGTPLEDVTGSGLVYTAGTDASNPSRMELFEYLDRAYNLLVSQNFDYVIPMDVYLDDANVADGDAFSASYLASITDGDDYPTAASDDDILGKLFIETYNGSRYYFWDLDNDGVADLYPSVGSASSTTKIDGTDLSSADFHEVNFAYQLARFCYEVTTNHKDCLGSIGTRPPADASLESLATWIGTAPTYTINSDGTRTISSIADNGTGLLGNKFMRGTYSYRGGEAYGGFILTDTEFLDGTEQTDDKGYYIDLGKYISVVAAYTKLFNAFDRTGFGYTASFAPTYMAFTSSLDEQSAPTNKVFRQIQQVYEVGPRDVDSLATAGYVFVYRTPRGMTISDAPTAARPLSDYRRLTTVRIVKLASSVVRAASINFIGEGFNNARKQAMYNAITQGLDRMVGGGYISRYTVDIKQTETQRVLGYANVDLMIVPAWELRRVTVTISLQPR